APQSSFNSKEAAFEEMLGTFKPTSTEADSITADYDKYIFSLDKNIIDSSAETVPYVNKDWGWSLTCPGSWHKNDNYDQSTETFYDSKSSSVIMVEAVSRSLEITGETDMEKFQTMKIMLNMDLDPVKVYKLKEKGNDITAYDFRIADDEAENYSNLTFYVFQTQKYSYCFMKTIPDLTSTDANNKVLEDIWKSFKLIETGVGD
ncbi:MAG: hypothetical protein HGA22_09055, partial [Clostridiales bacterium]|nr:hypothetical protein [Clostridiales bacterium]